MAIGQIQTEDDLRAFVLQQLRGSDLSRLVRQLQGGLHGERVVRGAVNGADGAKLSGSGFTSSRSAAGQYAVTFAPAFTLAPAIALAVDTTGNAYTAALAGLAGAGSFACFTFFTVTGALADRSFSFIAIG